MTSVVINGQAPIRLTVTQTPGVGAPGVGVPAGGSTGQVLAKNSATDYDTEWIAASGVGDLLAANNLSDVASAATARTNLGLAIGTNVQAYDADLAALAGISGSRGDIIVYGASGWERLAKSATSTDVLTAGATQPGWSAASGGSGITRAFPHPTAYTNASFTTTRSYLPLSAGLASTTNAGASLAQRPFWWPYITDRSITVAKIVTYCWTGEAGAYLRVGLYACDDDWVPSTLLADYGTIAGDTSGSKSVSGSTVVPAGLFCLCVWPSNHTTVRWSKPSAGNPMAFGEVGPADGNYQLGWRLQSETADYSAGLPSPRSASIYPFTAAVNPIVCYLQYSA